MRDFIIRKFASRKFALSLAVGTGIILVGLLAPVLNVSESTHSTTVYGLVATLTAYVGSNTLSRRGDLNKPKESSIKEE